MNTMAPVSVDDVDIPFTYDLMPKGVFVEEEQTLLLTITNHSETQSVELVNDGSAPYPSIDAPPRFGSDGFYLSLKGKESENSYLVSDKYLPNVTVSVEHTTGWTAEFYPHPTVGRYWIIHPERKGSIAPKKSLELKIECMTDENPGDCFVYIDARIKGAITAPKDTLKPHKYLKPVISSFDFTKTEPLLIGTYSTFSWKLLNIVGCTVTLNDEPVYETPKQLKLLPKEYVLKIYHSATAYETKKIIKPQFKHIIDAYIDAYDYEKKTISLKWKALNTAYCDITPKQSGVSPSSFKNLHPEDTATVTMLMPYLFQYTFTLTAYELETHTAFSCDFNIYPPDIIYFYIGSRLPLSSLADTPEYDILGGASDYMAPQDLDAGVYTELDSLPPYEDPPPRPPAPLVRLDWSISLNFTSAYLTGVGTITSEIATGQRWSNDYYRYTLDASNIIDGYYNEKFETRTIRISKEVIV